MTSKPIASSLSGRRTHLSIVPDAGLIDLFNTPDAVEQMLATVCEMLTVKRPDLMPNAGGGKAEAARPPSSCKSPSRLAPPYRLARLSKLMICSGSVAMSCRSPAFLHEQVPRQKFRTGRNPGRSKE